MSEVKAHMYSEFKFDNENSSLKECRLRFVEQLNQKKVNKTISIFAYLQYFTQKVYNYELYNITVYERKRIKKIVTS